MGLIFSQPPCYQCQSHGLTKVGQYRNSYGYGGDFYYCPSGHEWIEHGDGTQTLLPAWRCFRNSWISDGIKKDKKELESHINQNMELWIKHNYQLIDHQIQNEKRSHHQYGTQSEKNPSRRFRTQNQKKSPRRFRKSYN